MDVRESAGAKPLVLVVEDDVRAGRQLARLLTDDGFDVELAIDGAAAIARLSRGRMPDALVTDMYMPHADGLTVTRYARSRAPSLPVLFVTGHPELVDGPEARELSPSFAIFSKPLDYTELARHLRDAIR